MVTEAYLEADVKVVGVVAVEQQQSVRLVRLEPDVEFFVLIATVITVVQSTDVVHEPRTSVEDEPSVSARRHRRSGRRRRYVADELTNFIIIIVCATTTNYSSHRSSQKLQRNGSRTIRKIHQNAYD